MAWNRLRFARTTEALRAATTYMLGEPIIPTDGTNANRPFIGDGATAGGRALAFRDEAAIGVGAVIDSAYAAYTANADLAAVIPFDDTIPQISEGTQILSASITPKATTNKIRGRVLMVASHATSGAGLSVAVFVNSGTNALAARLVSLPSANVVVQLGLEFEHTPGATTAQTFTVRVGPHGGGAMRLNGTPAARLGGGSQGTTLVIEEIKA